MQNYQRIIMRAHEAFQHKLHQVEIELAEAQQKLETLDIQVLAHERRAALVMSQDPRLGGGSPLRLLPDELVLAIAVEAEKT